MFFDPGSIRAVLEANFISEYSGYDLPSSASACFTELLTFTVNCLLNDVTEVGEVLGVRLERNSQIIQNYVETVFPSLLDRQLDKDDAPMMKMIDK